MAAKMKLGPHIRKTRKSGTFEYRRAVPERIRPFINEIEGFETKVGRKELTKSLSTRNQREANALASVIDANVQSAFDAAELRANPPTAPVIPKVPTRKVTPAEISKALANWRKSLIEERKSEILNGIDLNSPYYEGINLVFDGPYNLKQISDYPSAQMGLYSKIPGFDQLLVSALAAAKLPMEANSPAIPQIRPLFARAWFLAYSELEQMASSPNSIWHSDDDEEAALTGPVPYVEAVENTASKKEPSKPVISTSIDKFLPDWKKERVASGEMKQRQADMYGRQIKNFVTSCGGLSLESVSKRNVRDWATSMLTRDNSPLKITTVRSRIAGLRNYWKYLQGRELVEDRAIFDKLDLPNTNRTTRSEERQAWNSEDIPVLWKAAKEKRDTVLADIIRLAAFTGGRIESLTSIKIEHIKIEDGIRSIYIPKDKNYSGERTIPIHPNLELQIDRMIKAVGAESGFLFKLGANNQYAERSPAISKRFGRLKKQMGFGSKLVFHSIRKTAATMFDRAGVSEKVAADILGHKISTMTYGLYASGSSASDKLKAMKAALDYKDRSFMDAN